MVNEAFTKFRKSLKNKEQREVLDRLLHKHSEECKKAINAEIDTDQRHTTILNMCAYAFSESGPLRTTGYHFIRVEPLYDYRGEKGNKIFDLVLYNNQNKKAILIECKSRMGTPGDILKDLADQIANTNDHKTELEEEVGGEIDDIEFVICSIPQDIEELARVVSDEPVILWSVDLFHFTLKLFNFGKDNGELIAKKQLHQDQNLREQLYEKTESRGQIEGTKITPSSHFCRILSRIFVKITQQILFKSSGEEKRFWLNDLTKVVSEELPWCEQNDVDRITEEIYKNSIELKLINIVQEKENPKDIEFGLKMGARNSKVVEQNVIDKYIESRCKERSPILAIAEYQKAVAESPGSLDYQFAKAEENSSEDK